MGLNPPPRNPGSTPVTEQDILSILSPIIYHLVTTRPHFLNISRVMRKCTMWFLNWSDILNRAVPAQKMARAWKFRFRFKKKRYCITIIHAEKTKALISFAVTAKLIFAFVFAYTKCLFSQDAAHIILHVPVL